MTVALITSQHEIAISQLERVYDNDKILGGDDIVEFLKLNIEKNVFFKRIVLAHGAVEDGESVFSFLKSYIENYSPNVEVVFMYDQTSKDLAEEFEEQFKAPVYTPVLLKENTTVNVLASYFSLPIIDLKAQHINDSQEARSQSLRDGRLDKSDIAKKKKPAKRKGFFSSLVGNIKKKPGKNQEQENQESLEIVEEENIPVEQVSPEIEAQPIYLETDDNSFNESSDALNFGEFGNEHFQTGFIDEDDLIEESSQTDGFVGNYMDPALATKMQNQPKPVATPESITLNTGYSVDLPLDNPKENLSTPTYSVEDVMVSENSSTKEKNLPSKFYDSFVKIPPTFILTKGLSIFVGDEAPRFIAHYLNNQRNFTLLEIGSREVAEKLNISSNTYNSDSNEDYHFMVQPSDVHNYLGAKDKKVVVICRDTTQLDNLYRQLHTQRLNTYTIFSSQVDKFQDELMTYENMSFEVAKTMNQGGAIFVEGINPRLSQILENGTFSRIGWNRMVA